MSDKVTDRLSNLCAAVKNYRIARKDIHEQETRIAEDEVMSIEQDVALRMGNSHCESNEMGVLYAALQLEAAVRESQAKKVAS
jgi:hypothetical protein